MNQDYTLLQSPRIEKLVTLVLMVTVIFVGALGLQAVFGLFEPRMAMGNIITVEGEGKVTAIPDIATISFTVTEEGSNASGAQDAAAKKVNIALALLANLDIEEQDIKTTSYSVSPKYSYPSPCYGPDCPAYYQDARIIGYTASQTVEVKVRNTDAAGDVLSQLGDAGVGNLYGPNFTIDDIDAIKAEARELAIADARTKAKSLAKNLHVSIVRVTGFWENMPYPYYGEYGLGGDVKAASTVPELPVGEGEYVSRVSVSYEIR